MRQELIKALPVACELFDLYWELSFQLRERIGTWGDDQPAYYLASTGRHLPHLDSDILRLMAPDGEIYTSFPARYFPRVPDVQGERLQLRRLHQREWGSAAGQQPGADQHDPDDGHAAGRPVPEALPPGIRDPRPRHPALRHLPGDRAGLRHRARHRDPGPIAGRRPGGGAAHARATARATGWWKRRAAR